MITLNARTLKSVKNFVSKDDTRYNINFMHLIAKDGKLTIEATNGARLMKATRSLRVEEDSNLDLFLDVSDLKIKKGATDFIFDGDKYIAENENGKFVVDIIKGIEFPNTKAVFDKKWVKPFSFEIFSLDNMKAIDQITDGFKCQIDFYQEQTDIFSTMKMKFEKDCVDYEVYVCPLTTK